ncbi:MAG TPA: DUF2950 family protein [Verrucomicrobiae bacterium]|jgi:hypothetical protein|nr:DUF2950 family protein [Verrucomicrobiae bacterium]
MKYYSRPITCFFRFSTAALLACAVTLAAHGQDPAGAPAAEQQTFASPDDAIVALRMAIESDDNAGLDKIFGPEIKSLRTGDKVQDAKNRRRFAAALAASCQLDKQSPDEIFVEVGTNNWPMPIPLVHTNGQWFFDTPAGKEEAIDRHIGKDELAAIGVCRVYVPAQQQFAAMSGGVYAEKFKSSEGKRDGLYWPSAQNEPASKFGRLVAEADMEGYSGGKGAQPFHGYFFKILTRQGPDAPGGKTDYMSDGSLKNGFALVAWPQHWNQSGIMTFIVNQDGKVYQTNFGEKTERIASKIKEYNPDSNWQLVQDEGIRDIMMEK